jgi:hypothetical protein
MFSFTVVLFFSGLSAASAAEQVIKTHRKTVDGRLCASSYTVDQRDFAGCVTLGNPDGVVGREWC